MKNPIYLVYLREWYNEQSKFLWAVFTSKKKAIEQMNYIAKEYIPYNFMCNDWWLDGDCSSQNRAIVRCNYPDKDQRVFEVRIEDVIVQNQIVK